MNEEIKDEINKLFDDVGEFIAYLRDRWQSEKDYEDWSEYEKVMTNRLKAKAEDLGMVIDIKKASKQPFGISFLYEGWIVAIIATATMVKWKADALSQTCYRSRK
jgi:hypothetical protein